MSNIEKLVKKLGFDPEKVQAEDFDLDAQIKAYNEKVNKEAVELFKNSGEYQQALDEKYTKATGKLLGTLDNDLKKVGIDPTQFDEDAKIEDKIKAVYEAAKQKYSSSKDVEKLQEELLETKNILNKTKEEYEGKIKEVENRSKQEILRDKIENQLSKDFYAIPKEKLVNKKHTEGMYKAIKSTLYSEYDTRINDSGELEFYLKGSEQKPTGEVEGKQVILNKTDIINKTLKELGFIVESNGNGHSGVSDPAPIQTQHPATKALAERIAKARAGQV